MADGVDGGFGAVLDAEFDEQGFEVSFDYVRLLMDDDGKAYLYYSSEENATMHVHGRTLPCSWPLRVRTT